MNGPAPAPAMPASPGRRLRINRDLLVLAAAVVLINLPYLKSEFLPGHDARTPLTMFAYFYNHLSVEHELPLWMVYGNYGLKSAAFQSCYLTPCSYLSMAGGLLFGVNDCKMLFVLSVVGEQLLFAFGVYLLSRRLFSDRLTILLVGFAAVCGTVWYWQIFFNFRIYHMLPLALYFFFRFTAEKRPEFFWMTGVTSLLGLLGSPPYFYAAHLLLFVMLAAGLGSTFWRALPCLKAGTRRNALGFGLLVLVAAVILLNFSQALTGVRIEAAGRDAVTGRATLENFLTYGGPTTLHILGSFAGIVSPFTWGPDGELTHYIGWLPLAALPVALLRCRNPYFISLIVAAGAFLLLSLGGTFACIAYRFPLMSLYRHVGCLTVLSKVLLLLASGFGIERILSGLSSGLDLERRVRFGLLASLFFALWFVLDAQIGGEKLVQLFKALELGDLRAPSVTLVMTLGLRMVAYLAAAAVVLWPSASTPRSSAFALPTARKALMTALVVDGLLFQTRILSQMPETYEPMSFPVRSMAYIERRGEPLDRSTEQKLSDWRLAGSGGAQYRITTCSIFQLDSPSITGADGWKNEHAAALMDLRVQVQPDPALSAVLGVTASKLRLVSSAVYVDSVEEAARIISQARSLDRQAVLRGVPRELQFAGPADPGPVAGTVVVKKFSANELVADVTLTQEDPAWLIYADGVHSGWEATVDGKRVPMAEAYLAFKGVRLDKGSHTVRFRFHDGLRSAGQKFLALLAALAALSAFAALAATVLCRPASPPSPTGAEAGRLL